MSKNSHDKSDAEKLAEANRKLREIKEMFYGQNYELANWHKNDTTEPLDNFFEQNDWEPVE